MSKKPDKVINLYFINKRFPQKPICYYISPPADMFNLKKRMLRFFDKNVKPTVTDFRLVTVGPPGDNKDDTISQNYFDEKYNDEDAYQLMTKIKNTNIYRTPNNEHHIYFRTIQATMPIKILSKSNEQNLEVPLAYEDNNCKLLLCFIKEKTGFEIHDLKHQIFQNTENIDSIKEEESLIDLKKYKDNGLIAYFFPIKAVFVNMETNVKTKTQLLKKNLPFINYLQDDILKQLDITSENISLKINNNGLIDVDINAPVHQILRNLNAEPVVVQVHQIIEPRNFTFQVKNGKYINESLVPSMKVGDALEELRKRKKKVDKNAFLIYMGRIVDNNSTLSSLFGNKGNDESEDSDEPFIIETEKQDEITVELKFQIGKAETNRNGKFKFIKDTNAYNVRYLASLLSEQNFDEISLEANDQLLNDEDTLEEDTLIIVDLTQAVPDAKKNAKKVNEILRRTARKVYEKQDSSNKNDEEVDLAVTQRLVKGTKLQESDEDSDLESFEEEEDEEEEDVIESAHGVIKENKKNPDEEYIFKFKIIGGEEFELPFPKEVSVKEVKEKIAEDRGAQSEDVTIFIGNQRLADFNKLAKLTIPKKVNFFSVKIIDLKNTLICTRVKK